jgi:hypothetical protein
LYGGVLLERALALGLRASDKIPEEMLQLMQLYPPPTRRQPSVEYLPLPYRSGRSDPKVGLFLSPK